MNSSRQTVTRRSAIQTKLGLLAAVGALVAGALGSPVRAQNACVPQDVVFVMDSSGGIGVAGWVQERELVAEMTTVGVDVDTRVAVVEFASGAWLRHGLTDSQDRDVIAQKVLALPLTKGRTQMRDGVQAAMDELAAHSGDRDGVIMLLTDGVPYPASQEPCPLVPELQAAGIRLLVLGVGEDWTSGPIECLVEDPATDIVLAEDIDESSFAAIRGQAGAFGERDSDGDGDVDSCDVCPFDAPDDDDDGDGVCDSDDACSLGDDHTDADGDSVADACDLCADADDRDDADGDGTPDACDRCAGGDDALDADADSVPDACDTCAGYDDLLDADADGIGNGCDVCTGDDLLDGDGDGVPDACDLCMLGDDAVDDDSDGVPNACDRCPGGDDLSDGDADGVPDLCDICSGDDTQDADQDGAPDACDACPGADDRRDVDGDFVPDACDRCAGADDLRDADGDTVPDACDVCAGADDREDVDGDGIPDGCDDCRGDDREDADGDLVPDACDRCAIGSDAQDDDRDGAPDACDVCAGHDDRADADADGVPDGCDSTDTQGDPDGQDGRGALAPGEFVPSRGPSGGNPEDRASLPAEDHAADVGAAGDGGDPKTSAGALGCAISSGVHPTGLRGWPACLLLLVALRRRLGQRLGRRV